MVSAVKNVLTVLAVAISSGVLGLDPRPSIYSVPYSGCPKTFFIYISVICSGSRRPRSKEASGKLSIVDRQKTNIGDRDLSPGRHFSCNIKQCGIDEFGYEGFIKFFLR